MQHQNALATILWQNIQCSLILFQAVAHLSHKKLVRVIPVMIHHISKNILLNLMYLLLMECTLLRSPAKVKKTVYVPPQKDEIETKEATGE